MSNFFRNVIASVVAIMSLTIGVEAQPASDIRYVKCVLTQADGQGKFVKNTGKADYRRLFGVFYELSGGVVVPGSLRMLDKTSLLGEDLAEKVIDNSAKAEVRNKNFSIQFVPRNGNRRIFWMTPNPVPAMNKTGLWFGQLTYVDNKTGLPRSSNAWGGVCGWSKAADVRLQFESDFK